MTRQAKRIADSRVSLSQLMLPTDANPQGNVHGGTVMRLVDEAGALAAVKHSGHHVVTVAVDSMTFLSPIYVGNLVTLTASLTYVGRTSMEAQVRVEAEDPLTGEKTHTNSAYVVYVALDEQGKPCQVPELIAETDEERKHMAEGRARQEARLAERGTA